MSRARGWTDRVLRLLILLGSGCTPPSAKEEPVDLDSDEDGWLSDEDCDDGDPTVYPGAPDVVDTAGADQNCDGADGVDDDGDGYASAESGGDDCDDEDPDLNPGEDDRCDGIDNDCDGELDEDPSSIVDAWYLDADGDGYGATETRIVACDQPEGYVENHRDCDDADPTLNPRTDEVCDGVDNDCDGETDEDDAEDAPLWYRDQDGDGYGYWGRAKYACEQPGGYVANDDDCDDTDDDVYPGATEVCEDGAVNDCDGEEAEAVALCGLGGAATLGIAEIKLTGEATYDRAGHAVSSAGDVDGDGLDDVLVGTYGESTAGVYAGSVYLLLAGGSLSGISGSLGLSGSDVQITGESVGDNAGWSVSSAGDVDGDGLDDLILGAPDEDAGGDEAGAAYVLLGGGSLDGASGPLPLASADLKLTGEAAGDNAGARVGSAGDVDGDGLIDLVASAPYEGTGGSEAGSVYLLLAGGALSGATGRLDLGEADLKLIGEAADGNAGWSASSAGDVDGDGLDDLLVGAAGDYPAGTMAGAAYLLLAGSSLDGASGELSLGDADLKLTGESAGDAAGFSASTVGDVDRDGAADLLVGAFLEDTTGDRAGAAYLLRGGSSLAGASGVLGLEDADLKLTAEDASDYAGFSVSSAGDVDGDGLDDALVGAPQESEHDWTGAAYLLLGGGSLADAAGEHGLEEADLKLTGEEDDDLAGSSVSSAGDVDGDGLDDLLIGADGVGADDDEFGAAYLVRGRSFTEGY